MAPAKSKNASFDSPKTNKRKDPPQSTSNHPKTHQNGPNKRAKTVFQARSISTQNADAALKNGELDLQLFLKAREFEIKALEDGMQDSKGVLRLRAFQQVPRDMRRRTAAHNVKRVPKRIRNRAKKEMILDNASTVDPSKRKPRSTRGRIRAETAKRLRILAAKKKAAKPTPEDGKGSESISTRAARPKIRKDRLNDPPKPKSKFRKRQIHKTWLPTHLWHAKRAKMTEPKNPLWRFSIPITSTEKSYRPTHRATGTRGAVAWDMSYMSTICLEGPTESLENVLRAVGVTEDEQWSKKGEKWRSGKRSWTGWLSRNFENRRLQIGPSTIIWCPPEEEAVSDSAPIISKKKPVRQLFIRIHPSVFLEIWTETLRLSKLQRPVVHATDLRFEIGSIDITGPGSTETLLGILHPSTESVGGHGHTFSSLAGLTNPGSVPNNAILSFIIMDPRLKYPPRPVTLPDASDEESNYALLELLSTWPADLSRGSPLIFDRNSRFKASRLPSQKSINRRKSLMPPGEYPLPLDNDPPIPVMLIASRASTSSSAQGTWTLLAPWKCILPIWHGIVHCPLSSGANPRFGGLQELRQTRFELSIPWFPADYPGTVAGYSWETDNRKTRKAEWERRPKGKRVEWGSLDLGAKRKGEVGLGWACDFEHLVGSAPVVQDGNATEVAKNSQDILAAQLSDSNIPIEQISAKAFLSLLSSANAELPPISVVATVRITLISRGIATPCARIYCLPSPAPSQEAASNSTPTSVREQWLSLLPATSQKGKPLPNPKTKGPKTATRIPLNTPLPQRVRLLAQSLLRAPPPDPKNDTEEDGHPIVPNEEDLIGFVTTGDFNLVEGKCIAFGALIVAKAVDGARREGKSGTGNSRLCIVRNAGEKIGRLARWEPVY